MNTNTNTNSNTNAVSLSKRDQARLNKTTAAIADLTAAGGIVAKGSWQTGTGNFKKAREIPVGAQLFARDAVKAPPARVSQWFVDHPRALACVAIVSN